MLGAVNHLEKRPWVLLIVSGKKHGYVRETENPAGKETLPEPGDLYAVAKACQNMFGGSCAKVPEVSSVRIFNHIGPNQSPAFVAADFC